jgi:hypothetical protein
VVEDVRGNISFNESPIGSCGDRPHRDCRLWKVIIRQLGSGISIGSAVNRAERLGKCLRVPSGRGRALELAAYIEGKPAGSSIAAGAGVVVESALVGAAVVVNDGRAEVEAVAQRRAIE